MVVKLESRVREGQEIESGSNVDSAVLDQSGGSRDFSEIVSLSTTRENMVCEEESMHQAANCEFARHENETYISLRRR